MIDLNKPRWSQRTFLGRLKHFYHLTHPRHMFHSAATLNSARGLIQAYKAGDRTSLQKLSIPDQWRIKYIYDSAFHPDTGEKMLYPFRMCTQVPSAVFIIAGMLAYHQTLGGVLLWQWINQSFNAILNYTNRNATSKVTNSHILTAYSSATTSAVAVSVLLNKMVKTTNSLAGRLVPMVAVVLANAINIPLMRQNEIKEGVRVSAEEGEICGKSRRAAIMAIFQTFIGRTIISLPSMFLCPLIYTRLLKRFPLLSKKKSLTILIPGVLTGIFYLPGIPLGCSAFPQTARLPVRLLESDLQLKVRQTHPDAKYVYFNKGL